MSELHVNDEKVNVDNNSPLEFTGALDRVVVILTD
jgi:hypothetical protein